MLKSKPRLLALAISAVMAPTALQAAVLEEVKVTATKRTESAQDVGISITAFTGDQMEALGWTNAQQVTSMAPGVSTIQPNGVLGLPSTRPMATSACFVVSACSVGSPISRTLRLNTAKPFCGTHGALSS